MHLAYLGEQSEEISLVFLRIEFMLQEKKIYVSREGKLLFQLNFLSPLADMFCSFNHKQIIYSLLVINIQSVWKNLTGLQKAAEHLWCDFK